MAAAGAAEAASSDSAGDAGSRSGDSPAWTAFCNAVHAGAEDAGESLLSGAITATRVKGIFEAYAERVIQGAQVFQELEAKEMSKREAGLRVAAAGQLDKALKQQHDKLEASTNKQLAAKDAEKEKIVEGNKVEIATRDEEIEKLKKLNAKMQTAYNKSQV